MKAYKDREVSLAKMRARSKRLREADVEAYRAKQKERYARDRDLIRSQQAASYQRHRETRLARAKELGTIDPDAALLKLAKRMLSEQTGLRIRDVPDDLAQAKALQIKIRRFARKAAL